MISICSFALGTIIDEQSEWDDIKKKETDRHWKNCTYMTCLRITSLHMILRFECRFKLKYSHKNGLYFKQKYPSSIMSYSEVACFISHVWQHELRFVQFIYLFCISMLYKTETYIFRVFISKNNAQSCFLVYFALFRTGRKQWCNVSEMQDGIIIYSIICMTQMEVLMWSSLAIVTALIHIWQN